MFARILCLLFLLVAVSARLGGWNSVDPNAEGVVHAISYALRTEYPDYVPLPSKYKVIDAKQQVVAGVLYDVILEFSPPGKGCQVEHFQIGDRFGDMSIRAHDVLSNACTVLNAD